MFPCSTPVRSQLLGADGSLLGKIFISNIFPNVSDCFFIFFTISLFLNFILLVRRLCFWAASTWRPPTGCGTTATRRAAFVRSNSSARGTTFTSLAATDTRRWHMYVRAWGSQTRGQSRPPQSQMGSIMTMLIDIHSHHIQQYFLDRVSGNIVFTVSPEQMRKLLNETQ